MDLDGYVESILEILVDNYIVNNRENNPALKNVGDEEVSEVVKINILDIEEKMKHNF